jgi:hypothetical protein
VLSYRSVLPLSSNTLRYVAKLITAYRSQIRSRWRRLSASRQALLVLAYLHDNLPFTRLAASFTVGVATAWRYVQETIGLLAMRAPSLAEALRTATGSGWGLVLMDGTLIPIDRVADQAPYYSGKHRRHGMLLIVLAGPQGQLLWCSKAYGARTHELTAADETGLLWATSQHQLSVLADKGYQGAPGHVLTPYRAERGWPLPPQYKKANTAHAGARGPGERANATLKTWRVLHKYRSSPHRATALTQAILTLETRP